MKDLPRASCLLRMNRPHLLGVLLCGGGPFASTSMNSRFTLSNISTGKKYKVGRTWQHVVCWGWKHATFDDLDFVWAL